jgi:hypothetical protein
MSVVRFVNDDLDFGPLPAEIDTLLKQGVAVHARAPAVAEAHFLAAIEQMPAALPAYRCLVKHYNRLRRFDEAHGVVERWLAEASHQANLGEDWRAWPAAPESALAALKAYAFVQLRRGEQQSATEAVHHLLRLDPSDGLGGSVVAALLNDDLDDN